MNGLPASGANAIAQMEEGFIRMGCYSTDRVIAALNREPRVPPKNCWIPFGRRRTNF